MPLTPDQELDLVEMLTHAAQLLPSYNEFTLIREPGGRLRMPQLVPPVLRERAGQETGPRRVAFCYAPESGSRQMAHLDYTLAGGRAELTGPMDFFSRAEKGNVGAATERLADIIIGLMRDAGVRFTSYCLFVEVPPEPAKGPEARRLAEICNEGIKAMLGEVKVPRFELAPGVDLDEE